MNTDKCFGIAGWKDSGKTSLVARLVTEITTRGLTVSTIKHAHHSFDLDAPQTDSYKHRSAGAREVVLVSSKRWAIQHELNGEDEPTFNEMLARLSPCDLVLVEGYKSGHIAKLEIRGTNSDNPILWKTDNHVKAIAADDPMPDCPLPHFKRDDITNIANFILKTCGIDP